MGLNMNIDGSDGVSLAFLISVITVDAGEPRRRFGRVATGRKTSPVLLYRTSERRREGCRRDRAVRLDRRGERNCFETRRDLFIGTSKHVVFFPV